MPLCGSKQHPTSSFCAYFLGIAELSSFDGPGILGTLMVFKVGIALVTCMAPVGEAINTGVSPAISNC